MRTTQALLAQALAHQACVGLAPDAVRHRRRARHRHVSIVVAAVQHRAGCGASRLRRCRPGLRAAWQCGGRRRPRHGARRGRRTPQQQARAQKLHAASRSRRRTHMKAETRATEISAARPDRYRCSSGPAQGPGRGESVLAGWSVGRPRSNGFFGLRSEKGQTPDASSRMLHCTLRRPFMCL
jgi:hypothetical protein